MLWEDPPIEYEVLVRNATNNSWYYNLADGITCSRRMRTLHAHAILTCAALGHVASIVIACLILGALLKLKPVALDGSLVCSPPSQPSLPVLALLLLSALRVRLRA